MDDEMYVSEELAELLHKRWISKLREDYQRKQKEKRALWDLFFIANICYLHDRDFCCECQKYATATKLPDDF